MPARGRVIFEATGAGAADGYLFNEPVRTFQADRIDDVPGVLIEAEDASKNGCFVAGYVAYEAGAVFEASVPRRSLDTPYAWFGAYDDAGRPSTADGKRLTDHEEAKVAHLRFSVPKPRYRRQIAAIREMVREGDVYQVNYTGQLRFDVDGPADALFRTLVKRQPVPYAAYLDTGDAQILSCSPELFFRREGRRIMTRPMKGTAARGKTAAEDAELATRLANDEKNRAENVMIVDLLRNDLSRCCLPGSVRAPKLFDTERYETLIQMSSEIEGELRPGAGLIDIFRALFPCGSVTGAPKIRAMQRIDALEDEPRGVYCGAIGFLKPGGDAVFNVAIRTAVLVNGTGRLGIGSGIVWDSRADAEYDECLLKARFLSGSQPLEAEPFYLIETMKAEEGEIPLLNLHMARLADSAEHFGIPFDRQTTVGRIQEILASDDPDEGGAPCAFKVRVTLDENAALRLERSPVGPRPERWSAAISEARIDAHDPLRRHKSSRRDLYEEKFQKALELGCDEVLFLNERGEIAEGSRSNVFVRNGRSWRTPPVSSGALPGVYRRHLIDSMPGLTEEVLYIKDVLDADAVYFSNAVVGLVEGRVVLHAVPQPGDAAGGTSCTVVR